MKYIVRVEFDVVSTDAVDVEVRADWLCKAEHTKGSVNDNITIGMPLL